MLSGYSVLDTRQKDLGAKGTNREGGSLDYGSQTDGGGGELQLRGARFVSCKPGYLGKPSSQSATRESTPPNQNRRRKAEYRSDDTAVAVAVAAATATCCRRCVCLRP
ncbi:unnamed protein product [Lasius platythorax]|uniref:Uncharacterized protein n=2 Tax=Lasius TaxID=488720 RepID=A0A0J7KYA9_LASNI|nr:hypothetical protein RF55_4255 [Lasius niger]